MKNILFTKYLFVILMGLSSGLLFLGNFADIEQLRFKGGGIGDISFLLTQIFPYIIGVIWVVVLFGVFNITKGRYYIYYKIIDFFILFSSGVFVLKDFIPLNTGVIDFFYSYVWYGLWILYGVMVSTLQFLTSGNQVRQ